MAAAPRDAVRKRSLVYADIEYRWKLTRDLFSGTLWSTP